MDGKLITHENPRAFVCVFRVLPVAANITRLRVAATILVLHHPPHVLTLLEGLHLIFRLALSPLH